MERRIPFHNKENDCFSSKLTRNEINMDQVCVRFNTHVLTNLFFGCGAIEFQEK